MIPPAHGSLHRTRPGREGTPLTRNSCCCHPSVTCWKKHDDVCGSTEPGRSIGSGELGDKCSNYNYTRAEQSATDVNDGVKATTARCLREQDVARGISSFQININNREQKGSSHQPEPTNRQSALREFTPTRFYLTTKLLPSKKMHLGRTYFFPTIMTVGSAILLPDPASAMLEADGGSTVGPGKGLVA